MVFLFQNQKEINNEVSALLRLVRTSYQSEIHLQLLNAVTLQEFKLKVLKKTQGCYKFMFLIKIPKLYPFEPLWAEPVIVCPQMRTQFLMENYTSHKLKPLIDYVLNFCQRFEPESTKNLVITFPAMKEYGYDNSTFKVCLQLNKDFMKAQGSMIHSVVNNEKFRNMTGFQFVGTSGFYNDMNTKSVKGLEKLKKSFTYRNLRKELIYGKNIVSRLNLHKSLDILYQKDMRAMNAFMIKEIKYCKPRSSKIKNMLVSFLKFPGGDSTIGFCDSLTIEVGDQLRIHLNKIHDALLIQKRPLMDCAVLVHTTLEMLKVQPKIVLNRSSFCLLPVPSKEIMSLSQYRDMLELLNSYLLLPSSFPHNQIDEEDELDPEICIHEPVFLKILEKGNSFTVEIGDSHDVECGSATEKACAEDLLRHSSSISSTFIVHPSTNKPFQSSLFHKGDLPKNEIGFSTKLRDSCSEIMCELVKYQESDQPYQYSIELDPRNKRHNVLLECLGIRSQNQQGRMEIIAASDYDIDYFFVKEIVNPKSKDFFIRLYLLSSEGRLYCLLKEENQYMKGLSTLNKTMWCISGTSQLSYDLFSSVSSMATMYLKKRRREQMMSEEASKLKCHNLPIVRSHFYKELVESLSSFRNSP